MQGWDEGYLISQDGLGHLVQALAHRRNSKVLCDVVQNGLGHLVQVQKF